MHNVKSRHQNILIAAVIGISAIASMVASAPSQRAPTLDITGLRVSPNPGFSCENSTIGFNVTNHMGQMVDFISVSVTAKGSAGGVDWQSNITLLADGATSIQSFVWGNPPEGTYDISVMVIGAGQLVSKNGAYTVLPCKAHVYIGSVTIVKSVQAPDESANVSVQVMNDGHAPAYNTTVAVQATGPQPDKTRYFLGSTILATIDAGKSSHPDFIWTPIPLPGVYNVTVMAIDENGVMTSSEASLVVDLRPHPNTVQILGIYIDPYPPMQGQEGNVTADILFHGNWSGMEVAITAHADGSSSYLLRNITLQNIMVSSIVKVKFPWLSTIEPGEYNLSVSVFGFNPQEVTTASKIVRQMAKQKAWLPSNFRLDISGLRISPFPPLPGQNVTVTVDIQNTGDMDAPPANLTVTAEGPAFYNLGTRQTPKTDFGSMVRMDFFWKQPFVPGGYVISAYIEDSGGNQSELRHTFVLPHVLDSNLTIVNGTTVYNYYYYGAAPNGSQGQNITVVVPTTLNETEAATGLANPAVAGAAGVAAGALVSIGTVLAYGLAKHKAQMGNVQSNPMYKDKGMEGQNPLYQDKGMAGVKPLYIHERMVHGVHNGPDNNPPAMAISEQGTPKKPPKGKEADPAGGETHEDTWYPNQQMTGGTGPGESTDGSTSQLPSMVRESPTLQSQGQTAVRESPTKVSLGQTSVRESPTLASAGVVTAREAGSGMATGRRQYEPLTVTDADGDAASDARMAINEKGLPGKKKPSANRLAGDGTEPLDDDSDDNGLPSDIRESPTKASTGGSALRESPTRPSREEMTGQLTGKRLGVGDTAPESPLGISDLGDHIEKGDRSNKTTSNAQDGDGGPDAGAGESGTDKSNVETARDGKKDFKGHVTLLK
jgi:hypothetical protein